MNKFFKSVILVACLSISACSNPEEDAKKLGFSSVAEMKAIQKRGFEKMSDFKSMKDLNPEYFYKNCKNASEETYNRNCLGQKISWRGEILEVNTIFGASVKVLKEDGSELVPGFTIDSKSLNEKISLDDKGKVIEFDGTLGKKNVVSPDVNLVSIIKFETVNEKTAREKIKNQASTEIFNFLSQCKSVFELQYQVYKEGNNPQTAIISQLNETVKQIAIDVGKDLNMSKSDVESKLTNNFNSYEKPFLSSEVEKAVIDKHRVLLEECNAKLTKDEKIKKLFNAKIEVVSKQIYNNETSGGLTRQQWQGRCSSYAASVNECAVSSNVSKCVETKMGVNDAYMAATYCNGSAPNWSLMGMKP